MLAVPRPHRHALVSQSEDECLRHSCSGRDAKQVSYTINIHKYPKGFLGQLRNVGVKEHVLIEVQTQQVLNGVTRLN